MSTNLVQIDQAIPPVSDREQWLKERKQYIGGSDCAAMFNEGYGCARRLVYDKREVPIDFPRTEQERQTLQRGTDLEELVVLRFQDETGLKVRRMGTRLSKIESRAGVNIDRQIVGVAPEFLERIFNTLNPPKGPGVLECKSANEMVFRKIEQEGVPSGYVFQMQHSLAVTEYEWGIFAVLGYGPTLWRLLWFAMLRDEALCGTILSKVGETWNYVENGPFPAALPQPDRRCARCEWRKTCLGSAFTAPPEDDGLYAEDDTLAEIGADFLRARDAADEATEVLDAVKKALKANLGDRQHVAIPSLGARIRYKEVVQERVDTNGLRSKFPDIAAQVVKPVRVRALYMDVAESL